LYFATLAATFLEGARMLIYEELSGECINAAIEVHRELGPGLLESAYRACLRHEFNVRGVRCEVAVPLPLVYKGIKLDCGYEMDIVVEDKIVLELKSIAALLPVHEAQLLTYLRLSKKRVGLLMNFNVPVLKDGVIRRVL
jgi:GxxExxY protein